MSILYIGEYYNFSWYTGLGTNTLYLSRTSGDTWEELYSVSGDEDPETILSYNWLISEPEAEHCFVKIIDDDDNEEVLGSEFSIETSTSGFRTGHIGAFYFGGDFTNGIAEYTIPTLTLTPTLSAGVNCVANYIPVTLRLIVPEEIATGIKYFDYQFSATSVSGENPLYVTFEVYNHIPKGKYEGLYEPTEYRWWFDYGVTSGANDYASCASNIAECIYCGFYGQEYDVKLEVLYSAEK
jgi:hypothetical protein